MKHRFRLSISTFLGGIGIKNTMICRCEEVMLSEITTAIEDGAKTTKEVKLRTRAGMGICQAKTCRPLLECAIAFHTNIEIPASSDLSTNNPVRPLTLAELARKD